MEQLTITNIYKKFLNTKKKITYLTGLLMDETLKEHTETHQIQNVFQLDSLIDMIDIVINDITQNAEHFESCGLPSNSIIDDLKYQNNPLDSLHIQHNEEQHTFKDINGNKCRGFIDNDKSTQENDKKLFLEENMESMKHIPKAIYPMLFYLFMKLDPTSILNTEDFASNMINTDTYEYNRNRDTPNDESIPPIDIHSID